MVVVVVDGCDGWWWWWMVVIGGGGWWWWWWKVVGGGGRWWVVVEGGGWWWRHSHVTEGRTYALLAPYLFHIVCKHFRIGSGLRHQNKHLLKGAHRHILALSETKRCRERLGGASGSTPAQIFVPGWGALARGFLAKVPLCESEHPGTNSKGNSGTERGHSGTIFVPGRLRGEDLVPKCLGQARSGTKPWSWTPQASDGLGPTQI